MNIQYITRNDYPLWDALCQKNEQATFWHTSFAIDYYIDSSFLIQAEQKSFIVYMNNKPIALMPVFLETIENQKYLSYGGSHLLSPIIDDSLNETMKQKVLQFILAKLDEMAQEQNVKRLKIAVGHLNDSFINQVNKYNYFLKYDGYVDCSELTCILDLRQTEEELFRNCTKGHKSSIKKGLQYLNVEIFDFESVTKKDIESFMQYYFEVAGKITRPTNTFENIYTWVKQGYAVLFKASYMGETCGYTLVNKYKNTAYYSMACKEKTKEEFNISHFLMWKSIEYLKKQNIFYYEMGLQHFQDKIYHFPSEKDKNISKFKRGFGGFLMPVFIAEKFYDINVYREVYKANIEQYSLRNF